MRSGRPTRPRAGLAPALLVALVAAGMACAAPQERLVLSESFFAVPVKKHAHLDLFASMENGTASYIGSTPEAPEIFGELKEIFGGAGEGLQPAVVAVSEDGHAILFFHEPKFARKRSGLAAGLVLYETGTGARLIRPQAEIHERWGSRWPKPLPRGLLVIKLDRALDPELTPLAVDTSGTQRPLALLGGTPLHAAAYDGRAEEVAHLVTSEPAAVEARSYFDLTPLEVAIFRGKEDAAIRLVEAGADLKQRDVFHRAIDEDRVKTVEAMLARGADLIGPDSHGVSPVCAAIRYAHPGPFVLFGEPPHEPDASPEPARMLDLLLSRGASPDQCGSAAASPLHWALGDFPYGAKKNVAAVRALLAHGARTDIRDANGNTLLHYLARAMRDERPFRSDPEWWSASETRVLLDILVPRMSIDAANAEGATALQIAIAENHLRTARYLLDKGARATPEDVKRLEAGLAAEWWRGKM